MHPCGMPTGNKRVRKMCMIFLSFNMGVTVKESGLGVVEWMEQGILRWTGQVIRINDFVKCMLEGFRENVGKGANYLKVSIQWMNRGDT